MSCSQKKHSFNFFLTHFANKLDSGILRNIREEGGETLIEINHLVKKYGNHTAVDDLNLHMEAGKIYGFLGPNGAGKSTTMNILTGYLGATSGSVKINGYDIFEQPEEAKKCVGYLPELPPLYVDMTVSEYLKFTAELKKIEKEKRNDAVKEAMELAKLTDMKDRLIRNLSKGYRQRVGLAQAVLGFPEVIILDEPTVGLDPKQMIEIRELIKSLGEKHTVILSSHILSEVSAVCDHIFIISHGKLVASDTTENLKLRMTNSQQIELLVKASEEEGREVVARISDVESNVLETGTEENTIRILLNAKKDKDIREEVFYAFADAKLPILSMKTEEKSLEDIFLELTESNSLETSGKEEAEEC